MTLAHDHRDYLISAAIRPEIIDSSGITTREETPRGIVFPWNDGTLEEPLPQLRPDEPQPDASGRPVKYRFPKDAKMILNRLRDEGAGPALIIEGTKQQYAGLSYAPEVFGVYGLSGCWNWAGADLSWAEGREVFILFDGDLTTNKDVHQAAAELTEQLDLSGASAIKYVRTTARGSDGLDDVLARLPEEKRAPALALWIGKALAKLPKAPAKKSSNPFFDKTDGFQVQKATEHLLQNQPAALTAERKVALYLNGVYHIDGTAFLSAVTEQLGDQFRPAWRAAMEEMTVGKLFASGKLLPEQSPFTKLNCTNGMLDLTTLELEPHSPEFMSTVQVAVAWDADAKAPTYEAWLGDVCPLQAEDLEEVVATMLDPTRTPHKAAFVFGPSRSGKSTMLRLLQAVAGVENRTAVTLHALAKDRFAAANVYGKMLNSAADLSSAHVEDLSSFKMMTGEDPIHANRKYGSQFTFTNQALFAFSANELPTVTESSRAYAERIKPFEFPHSYAGKENPAIEARMLHQELPGILVRWVHAYRRVLERGGYQKTDERVRREFETRSDRVAQWVADVCVITEVQGPGQILPDHQCTGRRETARAFNQWAERNGGHSMGERKVFDRLGHMAGIYEVRAGRSRQRAFNLVVKDDPNSDLGFYPEGPSAAVELRAERAVSEHPSHMTSPSAPGTEVVDLEGGEEKVHGKGASKLPVLPVTARAPGGYDPGDCTISYDEGGSVVGPQEYPEQEPVALGFDLETAAAEELFTGKHEGPFVRLAGAQDGDGTWQYLGPANETFTEELNRADVIYGHNILGFDLLALAHHHGADYDALAAKAIDTRVLAYLVEPPAAKAANVGYDLNSVAQRLGHEGKTDDLPALAKRYGGYDKIPVDSREYQDYLRGDLAATKAVYEALPYQGVIYKGSYAEREMEVVALQNRMTLNGWAADEPLLAERVAEEDGKRLEAIGQLNERYGVPLAAPDRFKLKAKAEWPDEFKVRTPYRAWRWEDVVQEPRVGWGEDFSEDESEDESEVIGRQLTWGTVARNRHGIARRYMNLFPEAAVARGLAERIPGKVHTKPWVTDAGKDALVKAFNGAGARHVPLSPKSGTLLTSADALGEGTWYCTERKRAIKGMLHPEVCAKRTPESNDAVRAIVDILLRATGVRDKYNQVTKMVTPQGRVHGPIGAPQGSGRWSMTPITTMGKRTPQALRERDILIADPGHVLIACDHSQLDVRTVAALSQDPELIAMLQPDADDYHTAMAEVYFNDRSAEARNRAKPINHGVNYGQGYKAIAERNGLDSEMVRAALEARGERFSKLMEWTEQVREQAAGGLLLDNGFGRLMRATPERAYTQAPALMGQGASRDVMCESLLRLVKLADGEELNVRPYLRAIVHDEIVVSVPEGEAELWSELLTRAMTWEWRGVPILCDVSKPAFRWSECK